MQSTENALLPFSATCGRNGVRININHRPTKNASCVRVLVLVVVCSFLPFSSSHHPVVRAFFTFSPAEQRRRCANSVDAAPPNDVFMRTVCIARMRWNALQYTPLVRVVVDRKLLISLSVERCNCVCVYMLHFCAILHAPCGPLLFLPLSLHTYSPPSATVVGPVTTF